MKNKKNGLLRFTARDDLREECLRLVALLICFLVGLYRALYEAPALLPLPVALIVSGFPFLIAWPCILTVWSEETKEILIKKSGDTDKHELEALIKNLSNDKVRLQALASEQQEELMRLDKLLQESNKPNKIDFEIEVRSDKDGRYTVAARTTGQLSTDETFFYYQQNAEIEEALESIYEGYAPNIEMMETIGVWLFQMLFSSPILASFSGADAVSDICLRLKVKPPELSQLPWELLFHPYQSFFLATRRTISLIRVIDSNRYIVPRKLGASPKILYAQSEPRDLESLNLAESERALFRSLNNRAEIEILSHATPTSLRQKLSEKFDIFHYDGHGAFNEDQGIGSLLLENERGYATEFTSSELSNCLDGSGVYLVVLAACETGAQSRKKQRFTGVAEHLMRTTDLNAVVAMQYAILDESAIAFIRGFYEALASGKAIDEAMPEGRMSILESAGMDSADWATPVLLMR